METAVNKLEAMQENPVKLLESLSTIKTRHKALCAQVEEIAAEQKQEGTGSSGDSWLTCPSTNTRAVLNEAKFVELSEADFEAVPRSVRSNTKLADLNAFYRQLFEHFAAKKNSRPLSLQQMKKMNVKANDTMLKTLKHLSVIDLDKKGHACLAGRD
ncbi:hypothetical protein JZ751_023116 [Albula glossodonta]|uniref:Ska2 N-terminal domain-containing protein n=1 Tax=Albula glossodonta TaxID=121402 RepID=A0A8T2PH56_9TELE|nr:hypothetical protein JZ751_023116 [Albula glossodonta]